MFESDFDRDQNRTLKTEQSNQSMKSKQQRETLFIVELLMGNTNNFKLWSLHNSNSENQSETFLRRAESRTTEKAEVTVVPTVAH